MKIRCYVCPRTIPVEQRDRWTEQSRPRVGETHWLCSEHSPLPLPRLGPWGGDLVATDSRQVEQARAYHEIFGRDD